MSFSVTSQAFSLENLICAIRTARGSLVCWTVILNHVQTVIKHRKIDCEGGERRERGKNNTRAVLMDEEIQLRSKNIYQPICHRCNKYIVRRWFNQVERNARSKRSDTEVFSSRPTLRRFPRSAQVRRLLIEKLSSLLSSCSTSCVVLCEMEGWRLRYLCFFARKNNWHEIPVWKRTFLCRINCFRVCRCRIAIDFYLNLHGRPVVVVIIISFQGMHMNRHGAIYGFDSFHGWSVVKSPTTWQWSGKFVQYVIDSH